MRYALTFAAVSTFALAASANEPCSTCTNQVPRSAAVRPNTGHPKPSLHAHKRYFGPVVSPNAQYGYFQTSWRPWDGGASFSGSAVPSVVEQPAPATPQAPTPNPMPNAKPETPGSGKTAAVGPRSNTYAGASSHR